MRYLIGVTALWAFSFSFIGVYIAGQVDSYFAVLTRITLALLVFAPMLRWSALGRGAAASLMAIGAVELGLMYVFFYQSFIWLSVPEVLLFTIFTPIYIALLEDLLSHRLRWRYLLAAAIAVAGAAVIRYTGVSDHFWGGFFVVQGANLCFAIGQVAYRRVAPTLPPELPVHAVFGWFFIGAWPLAALMFVVFGDASRLPQTITQWAVLLWLGIGASGLGYYAWNIGASRVSAGTLAVMNNALIPAGLAVNLLIWNHAVVMHRLLLGAAIIALALVVSGTGRRGASASD